jgi:hypothetical protein
MRDFDLTQPQAAGLVGNLGHESEGFQTLQERGMASGRGGYGWAQWTGPRRREFEGWAAAQGLDPASDAANYGFLKYELLGKYAGFTARLRQTQSLEEATRLTHEKHETPGDVLNGTYASYGSRLRYARQAMAAPVQTAAAAPVQTAAAAPVQTAAAAPVQTAAAAPVQTAAAAPAYGPPVPTAASTDAPGSTPGGPADSGGGDTSHKLEVHFMNAPAGMRSGLTRADGPAEVAVRTRITAWTI